MALSLILTTLLGLMPIYSQDNILEKTQSIPGRGGKTIYQSGGNRTRFQERTRSARTTRRPRDYVSRHGARVTASCFEGLSEEQKQLTINAFEADLSRVFEKIAQCRLRYPMLMYVSDVEFILKRAVVVCRARASDPYFASGLGAYTNVFPYLDVSNFFSRSFLQHASYEHLYQIFMPDNLFTFIQTILPDFRLGAYFHEALHYTSANNLAMERHNEVEGISYSHDQPCSTNLLDDRIMFVGAVCDFRYYVMGASINNIVERIERCGIRRGCMRSLQYVDEGWDAFFLEDPSRVYADPWEDEEARRFCQAIVTDGVRERRVSDLRSSFYTKAKDVAKRIDEADEETMMASYSVPARYLAALSQEERRQIASISDFAELFHLCQVDSDRTINPRNQLNQDCPFAIENLNDLTSKLVEFNNREAELRARSVAVVEAAENYVLRAGSDPAQIEELENQIRALYQENCPDSPLSGQFYPQLCFNGEAMLLGLITHARQSANP